MIPEDLVESDKDINRSKSKIPLGGIPLTPEEIEELRADLKAGMTEERREFFRKVLRKIGYEPKG